MLSFLHSAAGITRLGALPFLMALPAPAPRRSHQLVDTVTWLSMATVGLPEVESVTTNMSCEFVKPFGREGDDLYIEGECIQQGESAWA